MDKILLSKIQSSIYRNQSYILKATEGSQKIAKTSRVQKTKYVCCIRCLRVNNVVNNAQLVLEESPLVIYDSFSLFNAKTQSIKTLLEVTLTSLTSTAGTVFMIFQAILLYWFAVQDQTSISRQQKFNLFNLKFSPTYNEPNLTF